MVHHYPAAFRFWREDHPGGLRNGDVNTVAPDGRLVDLTLFRADRTVIVRLSRADARMLARRITQCLEASK